MSNILILALRLRCYDEYVYAREGTIVDFFFFFLNAMEMLPIFFTLIRKQCRSTYRQNKETVVYTTLG